MIKRIHILSTEVYVSNTGLLSFGLFFDSEIIQVGVYIGFPLFLIDS